MMIVVGDADSVPPSHAVAFFELLGGGKKGAAPACLPLSSPSYGIFAHAGVYRHAVSGGTPTGEPLI